MVMGEDLDIKMAETRAQAAFQLLTLIVPTIFLLLFTLVQLFVADNVYKPGAWTIPFTSVGSVLLAVLEYLRPGNINRSVGQYLSSLAYHIILATFLIFAAPLHSGYVFAWTLLLFVFYVKLNPKYIWMSYVALVGTMLATIWYRDIFTLDELTRSAIELMLVVIISELVISNRRYAQDELSITEQSLSQQRFERQRLLSLINNMGEAVAAIDAKGKILIYNAAVLALLDTNQTLDGKNLDSLLKLRDSKHKHVRFSQLLKSSPVGVTSTDYLHEFNPNDAINLYLNVAPIKLGFREESESGYIVIMRDITKEKSLEEERDEFISVVSHELRTPVAIAEGNISNALYLTTNGKNAPVKVTAESLTQAHDQVVFLASMINDLATLSRAERTDVELELSSVDPAALVHALGRDYEAQAGEKKLKLTVSAAENTKPIVTSELYLHEILQNFITNSIKYTKKGSIIVHVRTNKAGDAVFSVADTGIGLSKADQKRVFDKFFRSEDFRTRESSGTGLGLYVTAKLAHRLNAQITLESELNKGTTFTVTVPSLGTLTHHKKH